MADLDSGGVLVLAATPIGQPSDASPRLSEELGRADIVAAEDTRRLRRLASALGVEIAGRVVSYFEGNEEMRTPELVAALERGLRVVLVTDAGMPSVSDPGYRLVDAAVEAGIRVTSVPGPSAVVTALAVSGLPVARFGFEGFPPRRPGERARWFAALAEEERTMVFFESRHRLASTLSVMAETFGEKRRAAVCRELTKKHEEVRRGTLAELVHWAEHHGPLGEITVVVAGASDSLAGSGERAARSIDDAVAIVGDRVAAGSSRKDAIADVARELGLSRRELYAAVVNAPPNPG
ncbi:16S rRNA (cytidine(1402)-2'-O)-methyltransferase [Phytoactinopolyspora halotolerans]|uniref:Ribosomal RNA small subunit methyltransferase I n=1 Tax=Phytoactinopolyspora halotolerans TaxID=1981512 RepID=A0A6L9S6T0_9ACTN|nr:16S rRNA (cytidine(1402)-2'-O)-methyltransferase [Phytoactinopolyspora halotolerans]NEE00364.1 16S rRNA (cytidine(1402)-2'-O)-methyltransferase [Phytoactinopolyspora halotolerans]